MDQVDQQYLQEILKSGGDATEQDLKNDVKVVEDDTTHEDILVSCGMGEERKFYKTVFSRFGF